MSFSFVDLNVLEYFSVSFVSILEDRYYFILLII